MSARAAFEGATALVTGAGSGIGRALAVEVARRGGRVVLADRVVESAGDVADEIRSVGGEAEAVELDVRDYGAVRERVHRVARDHGRLDFLFNNAGIAVFGFADGYRVEDWKDLVDVNLRGVIHGVQAAYPILIEQGFGHIVNTASLTGLVPITGVGYSTTKHGVVGLSLTLRIEAEREGVRVTVLCPGFVRTPLIEGRRAVEELDAETRSRMLARIERARPASASAFASKALDGVARNRAIVIFPARYRVLWWLYRASPTLALRL
ncbi:MAG: SDR family oxidoreductase, partial [Gemmatimonadota bacterium]|nr:SDR family oxidoreductase [Gemmatimonadota bacterium]